MSGCNACGQRDCRGGCYAPRASYPDATLDDIKAWAKGMDLAVVPLEPTEAMLLAAKKFDCDHSDNEEWLFDEREYGDKTGAYKSMIKAAGEGG